MDIDTMAKILIIEDDAAFNILLRTWLIKNGYKAEGVFSGSEAKKYIKAHPYDIILSDLRLPDTDGIALLKWIKENSPESVVFIMTSYADVYTAVAAIKLGATDYLEKPVDTRDLLKKIEEALQVKNVSHAHKSVFIVGESPASKKLYEHLMLVAPTMLSVLITGESGTGKEYVANHIHRNSRQSQGPFIAVDCGAIPKDLAASELFGHVKGAFTSAIDDKKGAFELADGGTLFLDEIGNLNPDVQMQLLRALQEGIIKPVGGTKEIKVNIRTLVATNIDLTTAIAENRFREDLYHRINEFQLHVPMLRDRGRDILLFARHFLDNANRVMNKNVKGFSKEVEDKFLSYPWGGNLREMKNVITRAVLLCNTSRIEPENLPETFFSSSPDAVSLLPLKEQHEIKLIEEALRACDYNRTFTARLLGMDRKTLYNKMKRYGIE